MQIEPSTLEGVELSVLMSRDTVQNQIKAVFFVLASFAVIQIVLLALILWRVW